MRRAHVTGQDGSYLAELVRLMVDIDVGLFDGEPSARTVRVDR
jgi:GDP-D-mannose dehydratase